MPLHVPNDPTNEETGSHSDRFRADLYGKLDDWWVRRPLVVSEATCIHFLGPVHYWSVSGNDYYPSTAGDA